MRLIPSPRVLALFGLLGCTASIESTAITPTAPAAGGVILRGTAQRIQWVPPAGVASVDLSLAGADGTIAIAAGVPNTGTYDWQVPLTAGDALGAYELRIAPAGEVAAQGGAPVRLASLGTLRWNGTAEEYRWLNPVTGESMLLGTIGDLAFVAFPSPAAADPTAHHLYVLGADAANTPKLYTLDTRTGALVAQAQLHDGASTVVAHAGKVFLVRWNDAQAKEEITIVDPLTGTEQPFAPLSDLQFWVPQIALDEQRGFAFALGSDPMMRELMYGIDLATGEVIEHAPMAFGAWPATDIVGLGIDGDAQRTAFRWDDASQTEQFLRAFPPGTAEPMGTVGDLKTWSDVYVVQPSAGVVYAFGSNGTADKLYALDAATGALRYAQPLATAPSAAVLVY